MAQARERQRKEEQERLAREAAEAERKQKEEEEARERAEREAAEREAALARIREEKALSLGAEPDKGPNVTQVYSLLWFQLSSFILHYYVHSSKTNPSLSFAIPGIGAVSNRRTQGEEVLLYHNDTGCLRFCRFFRFDCGKL